MGESPLTLYEHLKGKQVKKHECQLYISHQQYIDLALTESLLIHKPYKLNLCMCSGTCVFSSTGTKNSLTLLPRGVQSSQECREIQPEGGGFYFLFFCFRDSSASSAVYQLVSASSQKLRAHLLSPLLLPAFNYFRTWLLIIHRYIACQLGSGDCCPIVTITCLYLPI